MYAIVEINEPIHINEEVWSYYSGLCEEWEEHCGKFDYLPEEDNCVEEVYKQRFVNL